MWYLLLYSYLTITFVKITFQTPLSITEQTAFQVSSCKSTYLCESTRQPVDMFVLSWLMLFEWLALCVRFSVCGNSGKHVAGCNSEWQMSGRDRICGMHNSHCITICCCKSHHTHTHTHTHTNSGRPMFFFMANANILESRLADIKPMYISHYLI